MIEIYEQNFNKLNPTTNFNKLNQFGVDFTELRIATGDRLKLVWPDEAHGSHLSHLFFRPRT